MLSVKQGRMTVDELWMRRSIKVLVVGAGGTGSEMIDGLVRLDHAVHSLGHVGGLQLTIMDGDRVSSSNVARQRFTPSDVGQHKASLLARRYSLIFGISIEGTARFLEKKDVTQLGRYDLIITCVDRASIRVLIGKAWRGRPSNTLWLDLGNGRNTGQVVLGHLGATSGERLPNVWDLFPTLAATPDDDEPSCSMREALLQQQLFVNRWMADAALALLVKLLTEGAICEHGAFVNLQKMQVAPMRINPVEWKGLGYESASG